MKLLKEKKYFKYILISLIVLILLVVGYFIMVNKSAVEVDSVDCFTLKTANLYKSINVSGKAVSDKVTNIFSEGEMPVDKVYVKVGDNVKVGDVICKLDASEIEKQLKNYQKMLKDFDEYHALALENYSDDVTYINEYSDANLLELKNRIDQYQKNYDEAKAFEDEYKKQYDTAAQNAENLSNNIAKLDENIKALQENPENTDVDIVEKIAELQKDKAKNEEMYNLAENEKIFYSEKCKSYNENAKEIHEILEQLKGQYELLKVESDKSVASAENSKKYAELDKTIRNNYIEQIDILKKKLEKTEITSTVSGVVSDIYVQDGGYVFGGKICQIQDHNKLHFEAYVLPDNIEELTKDSKLILQFASNNYEDVYGHITDIDSYYDNENGGYKISFTTDEDIDSYDIYPGFVVSVKIILAERHDIFTVPYDSIAEGENGKYYVEKYDEATDTSETIEVTKGLITDYYIEVSSEQLQEGDKIKMGLI
ncbi:MAG: biotin/lipoyl-binding protein [Acutalibacteraceae bacterium]|nr:biotin/lipoyl-binding protein [Acutalibacteraceae bacterium]